MTQEKLTDKAIDDALQAANDVILALAGEHEEVSSRDNKKMVELWDDLNDRYAPPGVVKAMALELQEHRQAESHPAGYHIIKECGRVGCSVEALEEAKSTRDFWNKKWDIKPYFYTPTQPAPAEDQKQ